MRFIKYLMNIINEHHQKIANYFVTLSAAAAIIGVWLTFISLDTSAKSVKNQLIEQKKATSVLIVSDFLTEIGNGIISGKKNEPEFKQLVVTRSQLLIDTLSFPQLTSQVIRFLGTNEFGYLFDSSIGLIDNTNGFQKRYIDLSRINLNNGNLEKINLSKPNIFCSQLNNLKMNSSIIDGASILYSNLQNSILNQTSLKKSTIQWTNLNGALLNGSDNLAGATICFSDLRNLRTKNVGKRDKKELKEIVQILSKARTLYGSIIDKEVKALLEEYINATGNMSYNDKVDNPDTVFCNANQKIPDTFKKLRNVYKNDKNKAEANWLKEWEHRQKKYCL